MTYINLLKTRTLLYILLYLLYSCLTSMQIHIAYQNAQSTRYT